MRPDEYVTVYVIWRTNEDNFFVTQIDNYFTRSQFENATIRQMCAAAFEFEYAEAIAEGSTVNAIDNGDSYEYITAFIGDVEFSAA